MHSLAFTSDYSLKYIDPSAVVAGVPSAYFESGTSAYSVLRKTHVEDDSAVDKLEGSLTFDEYEPSYLVETDAYFHVKSPLLVYKHNSVPSLSKNDFVRHSLSAFIEDSEIFFKCVVERLKSKNSGKGVMIDFENIILSVGDYYRFIFNLKLQVKEKNINTLYVSELVFDASELLSNMMGGISILSQGSVDRHIQFSMWMNDLEKTHD